MARDLRALSGHGRGLSLEEQIQLDNAKSKNKGALQLSRLSSREQIAKDIEEGKLSRWQGNVKLKQSEDFDKMEAIASNLAERQYEFDHDPNKDENFLRETRAGTALLGQLISAQARIATGNPWLIHDPATKAKMEQIQTLVDGLKKRGLGGESSSTTSGSKSSGGQPDRGTQRPDADALRRRGAAPAKPAAQSQPQRKKGDRATYKGQLVEWDGARWSPVK